jgi:hypothetical protein
MSSMRSEGHRQLVLLTSSMSSIPATNPRAEVALGRFTPEDLGIELNWNAVRY